RGPQGDGVGRRGGKTLTGARIGRALRRPGVRPDERLEPGHEPPALARAPCQKDARMEVRGARVLVIAAGFFVKLPQLRLEVTEFLEGQYRVHRCLLED